MIRDVGQSGFVQDERSKMFAKSRFKNERTTVF
jgi:hypothetical protein